MTSFDKLRNRLGKVVPRRRVSSGLTRCATASEFQAERDTRRVRRRDASLEFPTCDTFGIIVGQRTDVTWDMN